MDERTRIDQHARGFFEGLWQQGDHWELASSAFEQMKYVRTLALLNGESREMLGVTSKLG